MKWFTLTAVMTVAMISANVADAGLFSGHKHKNCDDCAPSCAAPADSCCAPAADSCCAPSSCDSCDGYGHKKRHFNLFRKMKWRKHGRKSCDSCCAPADSCCAPAKDGCCAPSNCNDKGCAPTCAAPCASCCAPTKCCN